jgi:hypothetical protein
VTKEIECQTFSDDMSFLRIRNLTLRCLASAVEIACASESNSRDVKQHHHNHQNNDGPVINGEVKEDDIGVTQYETFARISDELLNLYKSLTANPPAQVPQVSDTCFISVYYVCLDFSVSFFTCHSALSWQQDR